MHSTCGTRDRADAASCRILVPTPYLVLKDARGCWQCRNDEQWCWHTNHACCCPRWRREPPPNDVKSCLVQLAEGPRWRTLSNISPAESCWPAHRTTAVLLCRLPYSRNHGVATYWRQIRWLSSIRAPIRSDDGSLNQTSCWRHLHRHRKGDCEPRNNGPSAAVRLPLTRPIDLCGCRSPSHLKAAPGLSRRANLLPAPFP